MIRLATLVGVWVLAAEIVAPAVAAPRLPERSSDELLRRLHDGEALLLRNVRIRGDLDLRRVGVVERSFACRNCQLDGKLVASRVVFKRGIELRATRISGAVNLYGATFDGPAVFSPSSEGGTSFGSSANFGLATFNDVAGFTATFDGTANFALSRFRSDAVFGSAEFSGPATFAGAVFTESATFDGSIFDTGSTRDGAANFDRTEFARGADFSQAQFYQGASFASARILGDAAFVGALFEPGSGFAASFESVVANGALDFRDAEFEGVSVFPDLVASRVSFRDVEFGSRATAQMRDVSANDFFLELDALGHINEENREQVLELIESSAAARGDLGLANDAHYELQVLRSRDHWWLLRVADVLFYRWVAGYFVRPWHPLLALLVLTGAAATYRRARRRRLGGRRRSVRRVLESFGGLIGEWLDTLALILLGRGSRGGADEDDVGRRLEALTYRVLVVTALIGLANSNPTLRDMLDALS